MKVRALFLNNLLLPCLLFGAVAFADDVQSEDMSGAIDVKRSAMSQKQREEIQEILAQKEFGSKETLSGWRLKNYNPEDEGSDDDAEQFPEWLINVLEFFEGNQSSVVGLSQGIEVLLWALFIALILFVLIRYRDQIGSFAGRLNRSDKVREMPINMFGLDVKKDNLPENIVDAANTHWQKGESRLAIAVLLRATLIKLLHDYDCRFFDSDTEAECCLRVDKKSPVAVSGFMRSLVSVWQQVAYAHRRPSDAIFEDLCQRWQEVF